MVVTTSDEPAKEAEPAGVTETEKSPNKEAPQDATKSSAGAQAPDAEEALLQVDPLQVAPSIEGPKNPKTLSAQLPKEVVGIKLKK